MAWVSLFRKCAGPRTVGMRADVPFEFTSKISTEDLDEKTLLIGHRPLYRYLKGSN